MLPDPQCDPGAFVLYRVGKFICLLELQIELRRRCAIDILQVGGGNVVLQIIPREIGVDIQIRFGNGGFLLGKAGSRRPWAGIASIHIITSPVLWPEVRKICTVQLPDGVKVYGLGQGSSGTLNLRGVERRMWNQWDAFRYSGNAGIPFLMISQGYGVLLNSSWASRFVLGEGIPSAKSELATPPDMWGDEPVPQADPEKWSILLEGGDMDVFIIHGPDYGKILQGYAELTGNPPIMPKWALGYMQSKFGYKNQDEVLEVAGEMRRAAFRATSSSSISTGSGIFPIWNGSSPTGRIRKR